MFEHSIKVPRLYKTAARIVEKIKVDGTSVKQLVYEKKHPNLKALYALVVETLRNEENLRVILKKSEILEKESRLDPWLAKVLITELLWGKQKLPGESKPIKTVLSYQEKFLNIYTDKKTKIKKHRIVKPKYVRVNTLKISFEEAIDHFRNEGWSLVRCGDGSDYSAFLATLSSLSEDQFMVDTLIKDLLIFPPKTEFYQHNLYKNGSIVLQDKASCLSPFLLAPPKGAVVLDMCAAPGMKCMQAAQMVGEEGKVYAVERDPRRFDILKSLLESTDSKNVTPINNDVLKLTDFDVPNVEYILVDPSCSGSGIIDRIDFDDNPSVDEPRLKKLAGFQFMILRHALENFKNAKRIVYSTCSIYPDENESIVQEAIEKTPNFKLLKLSEILKEKWYNFGSKKCIIGSHCLYAKPEIDKTNGFFIAVFQRLQPGEINEFYIDKKAHNENETNSQNDSTDVIKQESCNKNIKIENAKDEEEIHKKHKKKCKKSKKEHTDEENINLEPKPKKKPKNDSQEDELEDNNIDRKKKKRKKNKESHQEHEIEIQDGDIKESESQPKKKRKKSQENELVEDHQSEKCEIDDGVELKPKKKNIKHEDENIDEFKLKKKSKKSKNLDPCETIEGSVETEIDNEAHNSKKAKKKSHKTAGESNGETVCEKKKKCKKSHKYKESIENGALSEKKSKKKHKNLDGSDILS